jgi:hypothetical protein
MLDTRLDDGAYKMINEYSYPNAQAVMNGAYEKWQNGWSYENFLDHLTYLERCVVVTGNLNYQVENGGFMQWYDNGYHKGSNTLLYFLENELATDTAKYVARLVRKCTERYDEYDSSLVWNKWPSYNSEIGSEGPETGHLDNAYYKINETLMSELESYVIRNRIVNVSCN